MAERRPRGAQCNFEINPMKEDETRLGDPRRAPKCGAKTRAGTPYQRLAIRGRKRQRNDSSGTEWAAQLKQRTQKGARHGYRRFRQEADYRAPADTARTTPSRTWGTDVCEISPELKRPS